MPVLRDQITPFGDSVVGDTLKEQALGSQARHD